MACVSVIVLNLAAALAAVHLRLAERPAIAAFAGASIVTYALMWFDKLLAYARKPRIPETVLACSVVAGGSIGFLLAAVFHWHKVRNAKLMSLGVGAAVLHGAAAAALP